VKAAVAAAALATLAACADTGQAPVTVAATAAGTAPAAIAVGDYTVTLTRADVGFGPAYFCAGANADGDQCATAVLELARTVAVDALDPTAQPLGDLDGVTGSIRSAMYDWGVSWLLTRDQPAANPGAPDGHSLVLEGTAVGAAPDAVPFAFTARVDAVPAGLGAPAVRAQRTELELVEDVAITLAVRVDPSAWLAQVPFTELDDGLGTPAAITAGTSAYTALVVGMTTLAPATFTWSRERL